MIDLFNNRGQRIRDGVMSFVSEVDSRLGVSAAASPINSENYSKLARCLSVASCSFAKEDFVNKTDDVLYKIRSDPALANLLCGPYFPLVVPFSTKRKVFLQLLKEAFEESQNYYERAQFRSFCTDADLESFVHGPWSRMPEGTVVGVYFPMALAGFSPIAAKEQLWELPPYVSVAGFTVVMAAAVTYPTMFSGMKTPLVLLDMLSEEISPIKEDRLLRKIPSLWLDHGRLEFGTRHFNGELIGAGFQEDSKFCSGGLFVF